MSNVVDLPECNQKKYQHEHQWGRGGEIPEKSSRGEKS